jgi:hypothetical protein
VTLEDGSGLVDLAFFDDSHEACAHTVFHSGLLLVRGTVEALAFADADDAVSAGGGQVVGSARWRGREPRRDGDGTELTEGYWWPVGRSRYLRPRNGSRARSEGRGE